METLVGGPNEFSVLPCFRASVIPCLLFFDYG